MRMKKSADELFAEINFQRADECSSYAHIYKNDTFKFQQEPTQAECMIIFFHSEKEYIFFIRRNNEPYSRYAKQVPMAIHKAIDKKIKELGWL